jgi:hypothetical protein
MKTTEPNTPERAPSGPESLPDAASERRTVGEILAEVVPLAGVIAWFGPPVAFLAGPWLLLVLVLAGPFAVVFTFLVVAALVVLVAGLILATPYLLVRQLRRHLAGRAAIRRPALRLASIEAPRVAR